jgi:hypothetical protein
MTYGGKRPFCKGKYEKVGSSIPVGNFPVDSDNFQCFPRGSFRKSSEKSKRKYCFHVPDISRVFLKDPVTFPHFFCEIQWQE